MFPAAAASRPLALRRSSRRASNCRSTATSFQGPGSALQVETKRQGMQVGGRGHMQDMGRSREVAKVAGNPW